MCYWPITILVILSASRIISMFLSVTITLIKNNSTNNFLAELVSSEHILDSKSLKALIMASSVHIGNEYADIISQEVKSICAIDFIFA